MKKILLIIGAIILSFVVFVMFFIRVDIIKDDIYYDRFIDILMKDHEEILL